MKSIRTELQMLLDTGVLQNQENVLYYENTKILTWRWAGAYTLTEEASQLFPEVTGGDDLIDYLWYISRKKNTPFFQNGKIRKCFFEEVLQRITGARKDYVVTAIQIQLVSDNWEKIPPKTQSTMTPWFTSTGIYCRHFLEKHILSSTGELIIETIQKTKYRPSQLNSDIWIPKTSPLSYPVIFCQNKINISLEETYYLSRYAQQCSKCSSWEYPEDLVVGLCPDCAGEYPEALQDYSTKATKFFGEALRKSKYPSTLLGVELEYEFTSPLKIKETLYLLHRELKEHAIFKRDGSLWNGIEICTRPASIDVHAEYLKTIFNDTFIKTRLLVEKTCGMHIHIDRRKFSALSLGKLVSFMQSERNKDFLEKIAGRSDNPYAKLATNLSVTSHHRGMATLDRYQGVNLQNKDTAEIRIFKSPDTYEKFISSLEFAIALASYVQPANRGIQEMEYPQFLKFVKSNKSTYSTLYKFTKDFSNA